MRRLHIPRRRISVIPVIPFRANMPRSCLTTITTNYENLVNNAILCDTSSSARLVEIQGPDAFRSVQHLTPRNLRNFRVGQCRHLLLVNEEGGILDDPIVLRLTPDTFWVKSLCRPNILQWTQKVMCRSDMFVNVRKPPVAPLQLRGPKAPEIMRSILGHSATQALSRFRCIFAEVEGIPIIVCRTDIEGVAGYDLYLQDAARFWGFLMERGGPMGLREGRPCEIHRVEAGVPNCSQDMSMDTNPFEVGYSRFVDLDTDLGFIGQSALRSLKAAGPRRQLVGLQLHGTPWVEGRPRSWDVFLNNRVVGRLTSAAFSPRLMSNVAMALVNTEALDLCMHVGRHVLQVRTALGDKARDARMVGMPFRRNQVR